MTMVFSSAAYQSAFIWMFPRLALFDAIVLFSSLFVYLLCISCPMDLQCPIIKAVTINQSMMMQRNP